MAMVLILVSSGCWKMMLSAPPTLPRAPGQSHLVLRLRSLFRLAGEGLGEGLSTRAQTRGDAPLPEFAQRARKFQPLHSPSIGSRLRRAQWRAPSGVNALIVSGESEGRGHMRFPSHAMRGGRRDGGGL